MINIKNKRKYFIAITVFILIIGICIIIINNVKDSKKDNETIDNVIIENNIKSEIVTMNPVDNIETSKTNKYKIVARSVVMPLDKADKNKIILLTIDDGPSVRTKDMMDILDKHNAKAIFFINGMHDKDNIGVIKEINNRGFAVGSHTWSHLNLKKEKNTTKIEKEINNNTDLIKKETGSSPKFFRVPYGESNLNLRNLIKKDGMIFMDWSGSVKDWEKSAKEKDVFVSNVIKNISPGSIILMHEHPWSLANLDSLLTEIESKGYTYVDPKDIVE